MTDQWYYRLFGEEFGPVSAQVLKQSIRVGQISEDDEVRCNGDIPWMKAREFVARGYAMQANGNSPVLLLGSDEPNDSVRRVDSDHRLSAVVDDWYCQSSRLAQGPHTFEQLLNEARCGRLSPNDQIRLGSNGSWRRAGSMGRLMAVMPFQRPASAEDELESAVPFRDAAPGQGASTNGSKPHSNGAAAPQATPVASSSGNGQNQLSSPAANGTSEEWFVLLSGLACGPMQLAQLIEWAQAGRVLPSDSVKLGRQSAWIPAHQVPGLIPSAPAKAQSAPATAVVPAATPTPIPSPAAIRTAAPPPAAAPVASVPQPVVKSATPAAGIPTTAQTERSNATTPPLTMAASTVSSYQPSKGYTPPPRTVAATPPKKWSPPASSKKAAKGRPGDGIDVGSLLRDNRVRGALGGVLAVVLLVVGWCLLPESTGKFREPYQKLKAIYDEVAKAAEAHPSPADWKTICDGTKKKLDPIDKDLKKINSGHPVSVLLLNSMAGLKGMTTAAKPEDAETRVNQAKRNLENARKMMKL